MTDADWIEVQITLFLAIAEGKLRTYPSLKQLRAKEDMLTRRFGALLDGLQAIDQPDKELRKQIARRMLEINDARGQLFDLEMERLRLMLTNPLNGRLA